MLNGSTFRSAGSDIVSDIKGPTQSDSKRISDNQIHRLSAALEAAHIGVFEYEPQTEKAHWDLRVGKIWGISDDEEITYETIIAGLHPEDVDKHNEMMIRAFDPNTGGLFDLEHRVIPRNGAPMRWVRTVATCFFEGGTPAILLGTVRDITEKRTLEERNKLLVNELQHRVKNTLATVMSVIRLSKSKDNDIEKYILSLEERLMSMSQTHSLVNRNDGRPIDIKTVVEKEFQAYAGPETELYDITGPSLFIPPAHVRIISMAVHELVTNASKHGALSVPNGKIAITTYLQDGTANFKWEETTGLETQDHGEPPETPKGGFGSFLLSKVVAAELQGAITYELDAGGLLFNLQFPLEEAA